MQVRLGVTFHHPFYAPFHVAQRRGFFQREGLDLVAEFVGAGELLNQRLEAGQYDLGLGGVIRAMTLYERGASSWPIHFARVNDGDGFFLVGRAAEFQWTDLLDKRLIPFQPAPTPWYVLRGLLVEKGLEPDRIEPLHNLAPEAAMAAYREKRAEFIELPAQLAEELAAEGSGFIVAEMAHEAGRLPYSSYSVRPEFLERQPEAVQAFARAHAATVDWMRSVSGAEIWEAIRPEFPQANPEVYQRAVERYHRLGVWTGGATIERSGYERLGHLLQLGGYLQRLAPYEAVCRTVPSD